DRRLDALALRRGRHPRGPCRGSRGRPAPHRAGRPVVGRPRPRLDHRGRRVVRRDRRRGALEPAAPAHVRPGGHGAAADLRLARRGGAGPGPGGRRRPHRALRRALRPRVGQLLPPRRRLRGLARRPRPVHPRGARRRDRLPGCPAALRPAPAGRRPVAAAHRRGRRPAGDGRALPARLAAHGAQVARGRTAGQRHVPARRPGAAAV
ncbi:MAG: Alkylated DNA repair protein AlkB, partial [uncultured Actinomycetospora sp.]